VFFKELFAAGWPLGFPDKKRVLLPEFFNLFKSDG
jgi:hypothetical protein